MDHRPSLRTADVRRRFDRAAVTFDTADFVHAHTRQGLFARLEPVVIDASNVIDLGCATGRATRQLAKKFRGARIIGVDLSGEMLARSKARQGWFNKSTFVQADAAALPFSSHSIDVVFSNMLLPWINDPAAIGREVARVLRKDGLFLFATLGPDSLLELRQAWAHVDDYQHVNRFLDMHDIGDALVRSGLRDPVLDVDRLTVTYADTTALFADLTAAGARNCISERQGSLCGTARFAAMRQYLEKTSPDANVQLDLELVYGHCWGAGAQFSGAEVHIEPGSIPLRQR